MDVVVKEALDIMPPDCYHYMYFTGKDHSLGSAARYLLAFPKLLLSVSCNFVPIFTY